MVESHFQQYFNYVVAVSYIGGGNSEIFSENSEYAEVDDIHMICFFKHIDYQWGYAAVLNARSGIG